jgi:hypothetical protein
LKIVGEEKSSPRLRVALILLFVPLFVHLCFIGMDVHNGYLEWRYECVTLKCEADFDGDGKPGYLMEDRLTPPAEPVIPAHESWLVAIDGGQELFRIPYRFRDNTLRTHAALVHEAGGDRLLIYDGIKAGAIPPNGVLAWDGEKLVHVEPSASDLRILAAMRARDDAGSWNDWVIFRLLSLAMVLLYYLPLTLIVILMMRHSWSLRKRGLNKLLTL